MKKANNMEKVFEFTESRTTNRTVNIKKVYNDFVYFEDISEILIDGETISPEIKTIKSTGFTSIDNIKRTKGLEVISKDIVVDWMYEGIGYIEYIPKDVFNDYISGKIEINKLWDYLVNSLTGNLEYNSEKDILLIFNHSSNQFADLDKNPIPTPIYFDYSNGWINNEYFDLQKLSEYLKTKPIGFVPPIYYQNLNGDDFDIQDIPYYNADEDRNKFISFTYLPTKEMANEMKNIEGSYDKYNYIIEHTELKNFKIN